MFQLNVRAKISSVTYIATVKFDSTEEIENLRRKTGDLFFGIYTEINNSAV